jgi:hypothetical protein
LLLRGREEGGEPVEDVRGDVVGGLLVAVHAQHVESGLDEAFGGLFVEVDFGVGAAGAELESVVWSAFVEALRDHCRVGFQDHGEVGSVGFGVELPQESGVDAVESLDDQPGGDVAVGDNGGAALDVGAYFGFDVVIPVSGIQAGEGVAGDGFGEFPR